MMVLIYANQAYVRSMHSKYHGLCHQDSRREVHNSHRDQYRDESACDKSKRHIVHRALATRRLAILACFCSLLLLHLITQSSKSLNNNLCNNQDYDDPFQNCSMVIVGCSHQNAVQIL
mmetsp:Transcript_39317/g.72010  ORF Transcript_39317/g.72010 Transcript_39317/m.72010 type:complete len:118 (+) Transcript_39317:30-383(+)